MTADGVATATSSALIERHYRKTAPERAWKWSFLVLYTLDLL
jgi:hypothetical protein